MKAEKRKILFNTKYVDHISAVDYETYARYSLYVTWNNLF